MDEYWSGRVAAIKASGMSLPEIAARCGIPYTPLVDIATGRTKEPRGLAAVKLHDLAASVEHANGNPDVEPAA